MAKGNAMVKKIVGDHVGTVVVPTNNVLAMRLRDPWNEATAKARETATHRENIVTTVQAMVLEGISQNNAVKLLLDRYTGQTLTPYILNSMTAVGKKGGAPTRSTICAWCTAYKEQGKNGLVPNHKGRVVEPSLWWGFALEYYNQPSKPDMSAVYRQLSEKDGFAVTYDQVCHYLRGLPAMYGAMSPARIGRKLYRLTQKEYIRRSTLQALAGDVYVADGYRADVYLQHPVTGDPTWRPELTVCIDLKSRFIPGWRADEHESSISVQNMWAETFTRHNHVPPFIYVDNGSGYKNSFLDDVDTGFYARAGIQEVIHSLPGNPHGKTWIERFFRIVKDDFLKLEWPLFYCGTDASPESLQRTVRETKAGRMQAPTLAEFTEKFNAWLERYHNRPHPENKNVTRAELWAELKPITPHASVLELKRRAVTLTVQRASIKHGKRSYGHSDLHAYNKQKVILEYSLDDNDVAKVTNLQGRWICDANLIKTIDAIAVTRLEEKRKLSAQGAVKRLEKKMIEQQDRAGHVIDADAIHDALVIEHEPQAIEAEDDGLIDLDLTNLDFNE